MGLLSIIRKQKAKDAEVRVLTLGLDNSGKTTIVKKMLGEDTQAISPTMGFQINTMTHAGYTLNIWDIGGQTTLRGFWGNYFDKTNVVVWVVDCMSVERLHESYTELREKVILEDRLVGVYLVVVINKIDLWQGDLEALQQRVVEVLDLDNLVEPEKWTVALASGITGEGLDEMLDWVVQRDY
ncbi:ARF/SAR superfamily [Suhomyces tanzawaensis NRRL Y-17324]|uniref:ARF/SAR superfamily n=1 Tax=Suhomyces tanzawaensis NRRL Y-17324 TaxID=984487 RepID=A0A1E4SDF4_9ASCO|nr:ARF/SAR superfamily [Suhomyces tanzawaensis NRRL Y-17324]ODV77422.1 ARF/SAR superfamily [Suhomyces tanzawaensis NRRL Y-17324]